MKPNKTLLIMRHAKSSWDQDGLKDFDRPLNKRGLKDAPEMGNYLNKLGIIPDLVISSPARRAKQTIQKLSAEVGYDPEKISWDDSLYFEGYEAYLNALRNVDEENVSTVLIAGHNPSVENLVSHLSGGEQRISITTANIVCFEVDVSGWKELDPLTCRFKWIVRPKDLNA